MDDRRDPPLIDTLLLVGLPASGKSVIGRLLTSESEGVAGLGVRFGPAVHLDDYPYVRIMWRISEFVRERHRHAVFLEPDGLLFVDPREWGTLINLLNEEYADLGRPPTAVPRAPAEWVLDRFEEAHARAGMSAALAGLEAGVRHELLSAIEEDATTVALDHARRRGGDGRNRVIEFSRGGPDGASLPLDAPYGYAHALPLLSAEILRNAVILYVHTTPEESRRRNALRAVPSADGSVLEHSVPETVMSAYYGTDDMPSLIADADVPGTVTVRAHGTRFHVPVASLDNSRDADGLRLGSSGLESDESLGVELRKAFAEVARHLSS